MLKDGLLSPNPLQGKRMWRLRGRKEPNECQGAVLASLASTFYIKYTNETEAAIEQELLYKEFLSNRAAGLIPGRS